MEASRVRLTFSEKNNPVGELREAPHAYSDAIVGVSNHPISLGVACVGNPPCSDPSLTHCDGP